MKITAEPRSDQLNADDFIGGPATFTISNVRAGTAEQKYDIDLAEVQGRCWRPPLTVLRIMISAWGDEAKNWIGQRVTLYRDDSVRFGKDAVGGIRIAAMTGITQPIELRLTSTRGKKGLHRVEVLTASPAPTNDLAERTRKAVEAFAALGWGEARLATEIGKPLDELTAGDLDMLGSMYASVKAGEQA